MSSAFHALVRKDLLLFLQDRRALILNLLAPILIAGFFGFLFGGTGASKPSRIPIAISDLDRSPLSQQVVAGLQADDALSVQLLDPEPAAELVRKGKLRAALQLPKGFAEQGRPRDVRCRQQARAAHRPRPLAAGRARPLARPAHPAGHAGAQPGRLRAAGQDLRRSARTGSRRQRPARGPARRPAGDVRQHRPRAGAAGSRRRQRSGRRPQPAVQLARRRGRGGEPPGRLQRLCPCLCRHGRAVHPDAGHRVRRRGCC